RCHLRQPHQIAGVRVDAGPARHHFGHARPLRLNPLEVGQIVQLAYHVRMLHITASFFELPPAHPILVNFTAPREPLSLLCATAGRVLRRTSLRDAGWWMIAFAALFTPFTALTGWFWMREADQPATGYLLVHKWLGITLAALLAVLALWRCGTQLRKADPS